MKALTKKLCGYSLPSSVMLLNLLPISTQPTWPSLALSQVFIDFKFSHSFTSPKPILVTTYSTLLEWSLPVLYLTICCLLIRPALSLSSTGCFPGGGHSAPPMPPVFPPRPSLLLQVPPRPH